MESRDRVGKLAVSDQLWSGRYVTATHVLNRQKCRRNDSRKSMNFFRVMLEKINTGLASVNEIIAGLGYKMCVFDGFHIK
jgi:hypothetical protein